MPPGTANVFESVNLASTIGSVKPSFRSRIPESTSGTSEDDDLDPEDFLSPQSPGTHTNHTFEKDHIDNPPKDSGIPEQHQFQSNSYDSHFKSPTASFSLGNLTLSTNTIKDESPASHLIRSNVSLLNEMKRLAKLHKHALKEGDSRLNKIRDSIANNIQRLSENDFALSELYSKEHARLIDLQNRISEWNERRNTILESIRRIKGKGSTDGNKLTRLLDECASIDEQISQLETHILKLKAKKQILVTEVNMTSSVLESNTSGLVEEFRNLESEVQKEILEALLLDGISETALSSLIRFTPVDVTFAQSYLPNPQTPSPIVVEKSTFPTESHTSAATQVTNPLQPAHEKEDEHLASLNHDHGPTPYERGYSRGSGLSSLLKAQLQHLLSAWSSDSSKGKSEPDIRLRIDDVSNTINEKVDLEPIEALLKSKIAILKQQYNSTSSQAVTFHHHYNLWRDCLEIFRAQEKRLESHIIESVSVVHGDKNLVQIMSSTLDRGYRVVESLLEKYPDLFFSDGSHQSGVIKCLQHEIRAVVSAISIVDKLKDYSERLAQFKNLFRSDASASVTSLSS